MNILFVNYGDCTSNSLNHIGAFANELCRGGHACVVAVPEKPETVAVLDAPLFPVRLFDQLLSDLPHFPDRRPADVIHAWTPRENVRDFVLHYLARHPQARLFIHLEDNEDHLSAAFARTPIAELRRLSDADLANKLAPSLSHPVRSRHFLRLAHGVTCITERLNEFVPSGTAHHLLLPGLTETTAPSADDIATERATLQQRPDEKLIVYTGSVTFANLADIRCLTLAVRQLNEAGQPTRLVRTGITPAEYDEALRDIGGDFVTALGWCPKSRLPRLLAAADVLVQPGAADDFNAYRLPSKIPEYLWAGRPLVIPATNIAAKLKDGHDALLLADATPDAIVTACQRLFADAELAANLGQNAAAFARQHFTLADNTRGLLSFYAQAEGHPGVFGEQPPTSHETAALVDRTDPELGARVRALATEVDDLKAALATARAEAHRHAANARYTASKLEAQKHVTENVRADLRAQREELPPLLKRLEEDAATIRELRGLLEHNERVQRDTIRSLEARVQKVTQSGSWVFTAPFRALRRSLLDPLLKKEEQTSVARVAAPGPSGDSAPAPASNDHLPIDPSLPHSLDEPADWAAIPARGLMRGWVVTSDQQEIVALRIKAADTTFNVDLGVPRPDVAGLHPGHPFADHAGFTADYELPPGWEGETVFEALTADGQWRRFAARQTRVMSDDPANLRRDYRSWVQRYDTLKLADAINHRARIEGMAAEARPLISVLMPVYNAPKPWLIRAIESVREQFYPNWELCIADDASTEPHVAEVLRDYAQRDARIKFVIREQNGHISAASNSALELATGAFCALLDHDDELTRHALAEVVYALEAQPNLTFIYSDEDKIDESGHRSDPYFKPDWNPELLLGQNYTCHLSTFRTTRLREIGGFREGLEGSQDWDLTLRATAGLDPARIHHIPKVLYHWRAIPGSTAFVIDEKADYPFQAAKRALTDHLAATGVSAELLPVEGRHWRVKYPLPDTPPQVSLIIPTHNGYELLKTCLDSLRGRTRYPDLEIIVVNHQSDDPTLLKYFTALKTEGVRVIDYEGVFNFSAINNHAARHARGSVLGFLNNDLEIIDETWLEEMVAQACRPEIGAVGAMLYYPNDTVQHAGVILGIGGLNGSPSVAGHAFKDYRRGDEGQRNRLRLVQNYSAVTAACLVIRREVFEQVGGFDERKLAVAFNDIDFCLRVRAAGYRNLWTPFAELYHHESASRGIEDNPDKLDRFAGEIATMRQRWGRELDHDPAYNPNLTGLYEDFSLATPPRG
ncbi:glycosyltransferase [Actomonas aquatica]|uniref:Glycosyltransferase n=1 Tax=Actomonas aquatica TaxID=2866162 RepID=A0ABZ1CE03_9BACT|nr:glycosyltransferase [Opitutus sp. WL0086]WRQ88515.1 glycosyltransferase [Opitutus sp. WL0086]